MILPNTFRSLFVAQATCHRLGSKCYANATRSSHSVPVPHEGNITGLPQHTDLLQHYRGLATLGKITYDEEQVRVIMQLRRLQKELDGYAPPALSARYLNTKPLTPGSSTESLDSSPWWAPSEDSSEDANPDKLALMRIRTHAEEIEALTTPKARSGLLLIGPPGCGKSFLIDMWFSMTPTPYKARKHYSELVLETYRGVWEETQRRMASVHQRDTSLEQSEPVSPSWNKAIRERWRELLGSGQLPIRWTRTPMSGWVSSLESVKPSIAFMVAQRLILRHWLLVFDEIQLLDVSSATLLADVLSWFWRMGGVIVGSSNKVPDDLYKNGVQRDRLEPFVEALKARCPVLILRSDHDWRVARTERTSEKSWYVYGQENKFYQKLRAYSDDGSGPRLTNLTVFGRTLGVPWSSGDVCKYTFSELCDESLGPADYMTLASTYRTVAITDIPILKLSAKNQARRFISLVDALYEARCRIICLAETQPERLFFPDTPPDTSNDDADSGAQSSDVDVMMAEAVAETQDVYRPNVSSYDAPNMAEAPEAPAAPLALDTLSIFSGKDEEFAFKRALSRLLEMTSESYADEERWIPLPLSLRKWESSSSPSGTAGSRDRAMRVPVCVSTDSAGADFASEAANEALSQPVGRPEAPRLSEVHVWGVREDWGERAKAWGRGARAYERSHPDSKDDRGRG
ncbi:uncharacterized protein LAESUDRAFT_643661 [Laetiporus sulphureus 93-53]|uniref:AFG1-like ATPase n=1 Tax=Laetiporus sulphureus 93-53 TaxID=1314785 RepID=A0A165GTG0_9APHY|nr:uncharacterized protein LAESUDRAFT_643661 [Laetiporus sulphureus 93-53]KZT10789.1 hypothetical protein LAESUDRAFT_643661 [Laetiporus sulphureus 93-53]